MEEGLDVHEQLVIITHRFAEVTQRKINYVRGLSRKISAPVLLEINHHRVNSRY